MKNKKGLVRLGALKGMIFERGFTQRTFARRVRIPESYISMIVNGRLNLKKSEQARIARALSCPVEEVFPESDK